MIEIDKKIVQIQKKIDEEKVTVSKCEEQLKKSKISLSNFEKDKKALLRLKKKAYRNMTEFNVFEHFKKHPHNWKCIRIRIRKTGFF